MAILINVGGTFDSNLTRNQLIEAALRKLGVLSGSAASTTQITRGAEALNLIIREEDLKGTDQARQLWALSEIYIKMVASMHTYTTTEGLPNSIIELVSVLYRNTSGVDNPIEIVTPSSYDAISEKVLTGDPIKAYLKENINFSSQLLFVWPALGSVGTTSEVTGTDSLNYICVKGHTAAAANRPVTGQDYRMYWYQSGSAGAAWVSGTAYTNGAMLRLTTKRALYDFDASTDNPDMPQGWVRYLLYRLAYDLSPEYGIDLDERLWIRTAYQEAYGNIFPSTRKENIDFHNKAVFY